MHRTNRLGAGRTPNDAKKAWALHEKLLRARKGGSITALLEELGKQG